MEEFKSRKPSEKSRRRAIGGVNNILEVSAMDDDGLEERECEIRVPMTEAEDCSSECLELSEEQVVCGYFCEEIGVFVHCYRRSFAIFVFHG